MMGWLLSPQGITITIVIIVAIASLIFWKRKTIAGWLRRYKVNEIEVGLGPVKAKLKDKNQEEESPAPAGGVHFGENNVFTGTKISRIAGRDQISGEAAAKTASTTSATEEQTTSVSFGKSSKFDQAEIQDIAGRDQVKD